MLVIVKVRVDHEPATKEIAEREAKWLKLVEKKQYECIWHKRGNLLFSSAIKLPIGPDKSMKRAAMTAATAAKMAELLKAKLLTKEEADLLFAESHHIAPVVSRPTGQGSPTSAALASMIAISDRIDLLARDETFLDNDGKLHLRGAADGEMINYGLVDKPEPRHPNVPPKRGNGLHMWQDVGRRHPKTHIDGTQFARFVRHLKGAETSALYDTPRSYHPERSQHALQWQRFLQKLSFDQADEQLWPGKADAAHGPKTQAATEYYLSGKWIKSATKPKAKPRKSRKSKAKPKAKPKAQPETKPEVGPTVMPFEMPPTTFVQASNYRKGRYHPTTHRPIDPRRVIVHVAQIDEVMTAAESLQSWATKDPGVSWHAAVDADSIARSVKREDTAFAAPGANNDGIHYELSGWVEQSTEDWHDDYSLRTLDNAAKAIAVDCFECGIPVVKLSVIDLRNDEDGIAGHNDVSLAFGKSTHCDPEPDFKTLRFPWKGFIEAVQHYHNLLKG